MKITDAETQQLVLLELKWDTRIDETDVGVEVDDGVVTLTGTVSSWAKRFAAEEAAHRVLGVLDVADNISVRSPSAVGRTDTQIAAAVRHALEWDIFVPEKRIRSTVSAGWVTLEGDVDSLRERDDAEGCIRNLDGVVGVTNNIDVEPRVAPRDVKQSIEEALERRAKREVNRVSVEVRDGRVTLSGVVDSWRERQAIIGAARGTHGVRSVEDRLRIQPLVA